MCHNAPWLSVPNMLIAVVKMVMCKDGSLVLTRSPPSALSYLPVLFLSSLLSSSAPFLIFCLLRSLSVTHLGV